MRYGHMEKCESCIQIKIKKKKRKERRRRIVCVRGGRKIILESEALSSLQDLRKSDRRFSSEQKAKSAHALRVTRGYQNLGVSSNFTR